MRRVPIKVRVTAAFTLVLVLVLTGTGIFQYLRFKAGFDNALNQGLRSRAGDVAALVMQADSGLAQGGGDRLAAGGESFAQILRPGGEVFDATPQVSGIALLSRADLARALRGPVLLEHAPVGRLRERSRLFALPVDAQGQRLVVVLGASLAQQHEALSQLAGLLVAGSLAASLLVAGAGYLAIAAALRPIELMRRRAAGISALEPGGRLPVPVASDEVSRLGNTLNAMLRRLEEAYARERRFVADASHELRTPLGILKTELELALRGIPTTEGLLAALSSAAEETDRLVQLAEDLLIIARADRGEMPIHHAEVDVRALFDDVTARFATRMTSQNRDWEILAPEGLHVSADPLRLDQALGNLLDNALRYGEGPITISAQPLARSVALHVADRGDGFDTAFLPEAFARFSRQNAARGDGGTGLGLAIVRAIARTHGGDAHAENRSGGGADVWITLPRRAAPLTDEEALPGSSGGRAQS